MKKQEKKGHGNQTQIGCSYTTEVPIALAAIGKLTTYQHNEEWTRRLINTDEDARSRPRDNKAKKRLRHLMNDKH